jgi:hypothetical protein
VISVPFGDYTDRTLNAQAASNMRFNVIDGWMQIAPPQARASARWWVLGRTRVRPNDVTTLKRDLCRIHVTYAVAWWPHRGRDGFFSALHLKARDVGHVWVYRLPGCSAPPPGREPGTRFSHREGGAGA